MSKSVLIIGGGAAGLMAAGTAAKRGLNVTVLERNERPARKVMITGKGRCNVTNACTLINELTDAVPVNSRFLYSAFSRFMPYDTMDFFEEMGVKLKIERGNRVFPESDKAVEIVDALVRFCKKSGAKIETSQRVRNLIIEDGEVRGAVTEDGKRYLADAVLLATGGCSYPLTGSSGDGYKFAKSAGHTIVTPKPSLVPLETEDSWCKRAQGLSLKNVAITITDKERYKQVYSDFGEMLFTHFGVSGPIILSASSHLGEITPDKYELSIDLKPALSEEKLDERLIRDFAKYSNKALGNALQELLPRKLIPVIVSLSGIEPDLRANKITRDMRHDLGYLLKNLTCTIKGTRPIEEAIITSGGVAVNEINPKTMESKICKGLYFAGELIDVDAYTGGFNLQIAFSTGVLAGKSMLGE
ncbi:MAG: NAD(P)/FAD-dependent oxidoreductase [Clostridia bacterium]|nr:NAD(P)/FAD-dependent oxidoreductase [Clostridia bacterium]